MTSNSDLELIKLVYETSPLFALLLIACGVFLFLKRIGVIGPLKLTDDHTEHCIAVLEKDIEMLKKSVSDINKEMDVLGGRDLHGRVSKIEGKMEGMD